LREGDKLNKFLVSSFDEAYFAKYGVSWFASLKEIANFDGMVILLAFDIENQKIIDVLKSNNIVVLSKKNVTDKRREVFDTISELQAHSQGMFSYFDIDGYFNDDISDLFEIKTDEYLMFASDYNMGFCYGSNFGWQMYRDYRTFEKFFQFEHSISGFVNFNKRIAQIDNIWNCLEPNRLSSDVKPKFIHYNRSIKQVTDNISDLDFSFQKKYPDLYEKWQFEFYGHPKTTMKNFLVRKKSN
jgi:hypothetical protein